MPQEITGTAVDGVGASIEGVNVVVKDDTGMLLGEATTDSGGAFSIKNAMDGQIYAIIAKCYGYVELLRVVTTNAAPPPSTTVRLALTRAKGQLRVHVGQAGLKVRLADAGSSKLMPPPTQDAQGVLTFSGLDGVYKLVVNSRLLPDDPVAVGPGDTEEIDYP